MNIVELLYLIKYFLIIVLICLIVFLTLLCLTSVPGNKKLISKYGDQKEKIKRNKLIKLVFKVGFIILINLVAVVIIINLITIGGK